MEVTRVLPEIVFTQSDGVAEVKVDRPEKFNALDGELLDNLYRLFGEMDDDPEIRVIVLSGTGGKAFMAGADIKEISGKLNPFEFRDYYLKFIKLSKRIMGLSKPVIAAVQGFAFGGGCLLALSCDMVIATRKSRFGQQEINYGFMGSAALLTKLVGKHKAAEIVMLGQVFDAAEAYRLGIVNKMVDEEDLAGEVNRICSLLISKSPEALHMIKNSIRVSLETGNDVSNLYESEVASLCISTAAAKAAIDSFLKKGQG